ncbi:hypothetical protein LPJ61_002935 [Coemansia biformis]|uniref:Uncharacterized protein n=1 Tax=Coemansia biformis TaxID=1286918 RepID=A0A9W8CYP7_9FUNG|nr:hypothetical protein LPJ61_002935 [Coemansia biformis]
MPLFGKRKPRLDAIIAEAAADARAYDRLYGAVPQYPNAAKETFQCVLQSIVAKPPRDKLRDRLMHSKSSNSSVAVNVSVRRGGGPDPEVHQSIAYLTVLHGVVWSFPYTMNVLFTDKDTCSVILKFILSTVIPLTVRETMLAMVSNWCVLYQQSIHARLNLEGIVDAVKDKINLHPVARLLPAPPYMLDQKGWHYPATTAQESPRPREIQSPGSMPVLAGRRGSSARSPGATAGAFDMGAHVDPAILAQQQELMNSYVGRGDPQMDSAFLSQQQELMSSYASRSTTRSRPSVSLLQTVDGASNAITPEFAAHMEKTAQELVSLCDMLTETLISLNVEEDPSKNGVVSDMMSDIKKRKHAHANFVGMLGPGHIDTLTRLTAATDSVDRCMWLYDKTVNSHNEWRAIRESLETSAGRAAGTDASRAPQYAPAQFSGGYQPESSRSAARLLAMSSSAAAASMSSVAAAAPSAVRSASSALLGSSYSSSSSNNYTNSGSGAHGSGELPQRQRASEGSISGSMQHPPARHASPAQGMSSKARGKMADTSLPDSPGHGYFGTDSAYGGSGERSGR